MGGDLSRLGARAPDALQVFANLLRAGAGSVEVFLRVALDLGGAGAPPLQLIPKLAKSVHQMRLIDRCCVGLALKEGFGIKGAGGAILSLRDVENDGMGVELGGRIAVYRPGSVMFELRRDEPARSLCRVVAADTGLGIPLQLRERGGYRFPVGLHHPFVPSYKCGEGDGLRRGKGRIPTGPVFDGLRDRTICVGLFGGDAMAHHLLAALGILAVRKGQKRFLADTA